MGNVRAIVLGNRETTRYPRRGSPALDSHTKELKGYLTLVYL